MEPLGSEYIVILNDRPLRESLVRNSASAPRTGGSHVFRRWFAQALHGLASRVDPATLRRLLGDRAGFAVDDRALRVRGDDARVARAGLWSWRGLGMQVDDGAQG
jgi:hypothetical protein